MKLKPFLFISLFALCGALTAATKKPNVLIFFIDDLGWADIGVNGSSFYETPHIDNLAKGGVNFTESYSAHPVCSPTRAAFMSGKAPQRVGITQWIHQPSSIHLPLSEVTIGEAFQQAGYSTGYIGKWHIGEKDEQMPSGQGFSWMKAVNRAGQPASYFYPYNSTENKQSGDSFWDVPDLENGKKGDYLTDAVTDHAINFIDINKEKPFFLIMAHYAVHTPIQAPQELVNKYTVKKEKLYGTSETPSVSDRYETVSRARQDHVTYAAMMESLDNNVGRVIAKLAAHKILDNTIVVFTSDNGGHCHLKRPGVTSNAPLRSGKGWNYEGGIRIPTIFYWKGKFNAASVDTPAITMDYYPTLLDLCGLDAKPQQHLDGLSLKPILEGKTSVQLNNRFLAWTYPHSHGSGHQPSAAIRKDGWKLIKFEVGKRFELYDLKNDIGEKKDLADQNPERVQQFDKLLDQWLAETTLK